MIAFDDEGALLFELAHLIAAKLRVSAIADNIAQHDDTIYAHRLDVMKARRQRLTIGVNIRDERREHESLVEPRRGSTGSVHP